MRKPEPMTMNRRDALKNALKLAGSGATLALPAVASQAAGAVKARFDHGVASGDPSVDGAILWTRATPV